MQQNLTPRRVGEHYEMFEKIGEGGMAVVYKGRNTLTDDVVAIKVLKTNAIAADPEVIERFEREASLLRKLNHPNIIKVLDIFRENDTHYIVMQYISGGSLRDLLTTEEVLGLDRALNIALELADALARAHHLGVVHRDIKPGNVLMTDEGLPMLTDFGVAHVEAMERLTETGMTIGTLDYLSPEALNGDPSEVKVDVWAFGVLLYEMIYGQRPFAGSNLVDVIRAITMDNVPNMDALSPPVPDTLKQLIISMLQKDPQQRLSSMRKAGAELEDVIYGESHVVTRFHTPSNPTGVDYSAIKLKLPLESKTPMPSPLPVQTEQSAVLSPAQGTDTTFAHPDKTVQPARKRPPVPVMMIGGLVVIGLIIAGLIAFSGDAPDTDDITEDVVVVSTPSSDSDNDNTDPDILSGGNELSNTMIREDLSDGRARFSNSYFSIEVPAAWQNALDNPLVSNLLQGDSSIEFLIGSSVLNAGSTTDLIAAEIARFLGIMIIREELDPGTYPIEWIEARQQVEVEKSGMTIIEISYLDTPSGEMVRFDNELPENMRPIGISRIIENFHVEDTTLYWIIFFTPQRHYDFVMEEMDTILDSFEVKSLP